MKIYIKNNWHKFIAFGALLFVVLGCSAIREIQEGVGKAQSPQVLTATDGSCQLTVPSTWRTETVLNELATLQASNRLGEQYVVVIRENKEDFGKSANLTVITDAIRDNLRLAVTNPVFSDSIPATVGGFPARQFEASGEVSGLKAKYLYAVVDTPQNYYQIITWTLTSRFEENRPKLMEVINSFKENAAANQPSAPSAIKAPSANKKL